MDRMKTDEEYVSGTAERIEETLKSREDEEE
jgi:hypothetical protein